MNIWFTSDLHLGHRKVIEYWNRPFLDHAIADVHDPRRYKLEEMDAFLISNWNRLVEKRDVVYVIGDFIWGGFENWKKYSGQLKGDIRLVLGNHDNANSARKLLKHVYEYKMISIERQKIALFHYGMRTWDRARKGSWHLYGHSHNSLPPFGKSLDVGVDCWDFHPVSFQLLKTVLDRRPLSEQDEEATNHHWSMIHGYRRLPVDLEEEVPEGE
jgi:calcineurin-like phosphoesterase family protein